MAGGEYAGIAARAVADWESNNKDKLTAEDTQEIRETPGGPEFRATGQLADVAAAAMPSKASSRDQDKEPLRNPNGDSRNEEKAVTGLGQTPERAALVVLDKTKKWIFMLYHRTRGSTACTTVPAVG